MYTIKRYKLTSLGDIKEVLAVNLQGKGSKFVSASNVALKFRTPKEASDYFKDAEIEGLVGCRVFIEGPKGGTYYISNGKIQK